MNCHLLLCQLLKNCCFKRIVLHFWDVNVFPWWYGNPEKFPYKKCHKYTHFIFGNPFFQQHLVRLSMNDKQSMKGSKVQHHNFIRHDKTNLHLCGYDLF